MKASLMKIVKKNLIAMVGAASLVIPVTGSSAILISYPFTGGSAASTVTDPDTTNSNILGGNAKVAISGSAANLYYEFPDESGQKDKDQAIADGYYAAFTLAPHSGYTASYSNLSLNYGGSYNNTGSVTAVSYQANFFIRTSLDDYASDVVSFSYAVPYLSGATHTPQLLNLDLSTLAEFQNVEEAVTFRIYGFSDNFIGSTFNVSARPRVDNVVLQGEIAVIPEPETGALLIVSLVYIVAFRRRTRLNVVL